MTRIGETFQPGASASLKQAISDAPAGRRNLGGRYTGHYGAESANPLRVCA
jgi:hypothetical protein